MDSVTKQCRDCGQDKLLTDFFKKRENSYQSYCKSCSAVRNERNVAIRKDPDLRAARDAERAEQDRIKQENAPVEKLCKLCGEVKPVAAFRPRRRVCRQCGMATRDPELAREALHRYEDRHREERREKSRQDYAKRRDEKADRQRKWRAAHRESSRRAATEYKRRNPGLNRITCQKRKARKLGNGGVFTLDEWERLKAQCDWACVACGKREPDIALHADHVVPLVMGGWNIISNIQPLCPRCNSSKNAKFIDYRVNPYSL